MKIYVGDEFLDLDEETLDYMYIDEGNEFSLDDYEYRKAIRRAYIFFEHGIQKTDEEYAKLKARDGE